MNILVVDDSKLMRAVLRGMLVNMGFNDIYEANNGLEAIRKAYMVNPDIVFMNLLMPEMDGFEASKKILETFEQVKIVVVSSDAYADNSSILSKIKIHDYLSSPIKEERLKEIMFKVEKYAMRF